MDKELLIRDFEERMGELGLKTLYAHAIEKGLSEMYSHDMDTADHGLRVARITRKMAKLFGLDETLGFVAGLLHDMGKLGISGKVLSSHSISPSDKQEIMLHPDGSYDFCMSHGLYRSAHISQRHHKSQNGSSYPERLHDYRKSTSDKDTVHMEQIARVISVADCCDALKRMNDYLGRQIIKTPQDLLEQILKQRPYSADLILPAFEARILQNGYFDRKALH